MEKAGESFYSPRLSLRSFVTLFFYSFLPFFFFFHLHLNVFLFPKQIVDFFFPSLKDDVGTKGIMGEIYITGGLLSLSLIFFIYTLLDNMHAYIPIPGENPFSLFCHVSLPPTSFFFLYSP